MVGIPAVGLVISIVVLKEVLVLEDPYGPIYNSLTVVLVLEPQALPILLDNNTGNYSERRKASFCSFVFCVWMRRMR